MFIVYSWTDYFFFFSFIIIIIIICHYLAFTAGFRLQFYYVIMDSFLMTPLYSRLVSTGKHLFISYYSCNWFGALEYSVFSFSLVYGFQFISSHPLFSNWVFFVSTLKHIIQYFILCHSSVCFFFFFSSVFLNFLTFSSTMQFGRRGICITESVMGRFPLLGVCILSNL